FRRQPFANWRKVRNKMVPAGYRFRNCQAQMTVFAQAGQRGERHPSASAGLTHAQPLTPSVLTQSGDSKAAAGRASKHRNEIEAKSRIVWASYAVEEACYSACCARVDGSLGSGHADKRTW